MPNDEEQLMTDYKHVFGTDSGQRVLQDLAEFAGFQAPSYHPDEDSSGRKMAFREGHRNVLSYIFTKVELSRAEFQKKVRQETAKSE